MRSEKLFREMLDLFEALTAVYAEVDEDVEPSDDGQGVGEDELIDVIVEEAEDRGLDGEATAHFLHAAIGGAKKSARG